MKDILFV